MAKNTIKVKRTSVSGRLPNTTNSGNAQYINAGEFALNMADGILYSSNGSVVIEIGANNTNQTITNALTFSTNSKIVANGSIGTVGQVLTATGNGVRWATSSGGGGGSSVYLKGGPETIGSLEIEGQNIFRVNANTLNVNTTFESGENAQATGPISVSDGIVLAVEEGARVSII